MFEKTPLEDFINYKSNTGSQCGNYSIDIPELKEGEQYRFHFDMTTCIGCHCCEVACNEQNNNPANIKWRRVGEMEAGEFPNTIELFNSMSCNHCIDPACLKGCPTESYIKLENGIVIHDDDSCIGCQYCTWNCPYEVPVFHSERKIVTKCNMCNDRLEENQTPACVQACPAGAIQIEVVNKDEWLKDDIDKFGNTPNLVDARITNSTTRYTLSDKLPKDFKNADEHILKPNHKEIPLIFMTILTQISLGGCLAFLLGDFLNLIGFNLPQPSFIMALLVLLPSAIGLPLSALHLGRPYRAIMAMKNIKNSYLSKEALALGLYTLGLSLIVFLTLIEFNQFFKVLLEITIFIIGVFGIYYQSMIYRVEARPSWNREITTYKFFGVSYIGVFLLALISFSLDNLNAVTAIISLGLMLAVIQSYLFLENINFFKRLNKDDKYYYQLNRTKKLMFNNFGNLIKLRGLLLVSCALVLPLLTITLLASNSFILGFITLFISLVGSIGSELIGRYLFYTTVVSLGLSGNFFAGNQRG